MTHWFKAVNGLFLPTPPGEPTINETGDIVFYDGPNWNGRTNVKRMKDGNYILVYMDSTAHHINTNSRAMVRFSREGTYWTEQNTYFDGTAITPFAPPASGNSGAGESWTYIAPNGTVIIHTWRCDYNVYNGGTYQWHSNDHGKTWTSDGQVSFAGITNQNQVFSTDDDFVYRGVIYAGARQYAPGVLVQDDGIKSMFIKNENNGAVGDWEWVSDITDYVTHPTNEVGLAYVGGSRIVAILRGTPYGSTYRGVSDDFGLSWTITDITSGPFAVSGRHRLKSRAYLQGRIDYWNDPVWICTGFVATTGEAHPRRNCIWVSKDRCETFSGPLWLDVEGEDGGYNDMMWDQDYKCFAYYAPTSLYDGYIKQYDFQLLFDGIPV
jgi:hypothetical protein